MNLQPKQMQALRTLLNPQCKYLLYGGAMAGGKSYLLRWAALYYELWLSKKYGARHVPVGIFCENYPALIDRQVSRIVREFPRELGELKSSDKEGFAFFIDEEYGGGRILLRNLDDPSKYMSSEFAGEFIDELTKNPETHFQDLRNRLRFPGIEYVKFMGASNPGGIGNSWVRKYFVDQVSDDPEQDRFFYVHASAYDNQYITRDYIRQLEALPDKKRRAYLEGSWDVFEGQVFTEFRRDRHVCPPFLPKVTLPLVAGMDWGFNDPMVLLAGVFYEKTWQHPDTGQMVKFNRLYLYREIDGHEMTPKQWAVEMKRLMPELPRVTIYGDPAMFNQLQDTSFSIADQFKREGIYVKKATHNRLTSITTIHNWLSDAPDGLPYMIIAENCRNLIRTLPEAVYDDVHTEDIDQAWREDHWTDALRYVTAMVKWIDAGRVGGIGSFRKRIRPHYTARMDEEGNQIPINISAFERPKKKRGVWYPR